MKTCEALLVGEELCYWERFKSSFSDIINDISEYRKIRDFCSSNEASNNYLFYSSYGFPFDLFIDDIIMKRFNINHIYRKEVIWNKSIIYNENQYFFEFDLDNPNMTKKYEVLTELLLSIIKTKPIMNGKHLIIIKNIDKLNEFFFSFRIILERYSHNCFFICSTNKISKIEAPIKSRFCLFRIRLFTNNEIIKIFNSNLKISLNGNLIKNNCRNIIFAIFIAQTELYEPQLITEEFCNLNYPPIKDFVSTNFSLNDLRQLSYKYSQYNLGIKDLSLDLLKIHKNKYKLILDNSIELENLLNNSNKGREPIYIEALLSQVLL